MDTLFAAFLAAGDDARQVRAALEGAPRDRIVLAAVLRRAVPLRCLEVLASTPPWSEDQRLLGSVVLSPRASRALALKLVGSLFWRDLADVAASPRVTAAARVRAEALLVDYMEDLRLGDRITLAKIATGPVLARLLEDALNRARRAGFNELQLDVLADNPATQFYAAFGLRVVVETISPELSRDFGFPSELRMAISL